MLYSYRNTSILGQYRGRVSRKVGGENSKSELTKFTVAIKPEPNMLKILLIIPSITSQKFTHYSYFITTSLPINPILFFTLMFQLCI